MIKIFHRPPPSDVHQRRKQCRRQVYCAKRGMTFLLFLQSLKKNENGGRFFGFSNPHDHFALLLSTCFVYYYLSIIDNHGEEHMTTVEMTKATFICLSLCVSMIDEGKKSLGSYPTIVRVAVFSTFVLPIAFLPYWAARRHVHALRQRVERLEIGAKHLTQSLAITSSVQKWTKDELGRVHSRVQNAMKETHDWQAQQEANRIASNDTIRTELHKSLQETQQLRYV